MRPPEEVKREFVRQWTSKAEADFGLAQYILEQRAPYLDAVAFHAQQAAEKYLKALLTHREIRFPKTHDLAELLDLVQGADSPLAQSLQGAIALSDYAVAPRYPEGPPEATPEEARRAVQMADEVRRAVRSALGMATSSR